MNKVLILFAHPALQKSSVNLKITEGLQQEENITFHDLYQKYPEMDIDKKHEQKLLLEHDVIIFHHPFYWYSTPAILKEWQDLVLEHGWAYGKEGNELTGKLFFNVITTGGKAEAYSNEGYNRFTIRQFLAPIERTAGLCKMIYLPPFVIHGTHSINDEQIYKYREQYILILKSLINNKINPTDTEKLDYLNDYFK